MHTKDKTVDKLEKQLFALKKKLAAARYKAGKQPVNDYQLFGWNGMTVRLSELFGNKSELIIIHNMGRQCSHCTLWADAFNGMLGHLEDRAAFVVSSPDEHLVQRKFAESRNWKFRMVSDRDTAFRKDMGFVDKQGRPLPGVSTFQKDKKGRIIRIASADFGPGDDYCSIWSLFDLLPGGSKDWSPKFHYGGNTALNEWPRVPDAASV